MERISFPGLDVSAFVTSQDRAALATLEKVPLLPQIVRKFHEIGLDRWMYVHNMGRSIRCSPRQFKTLHAIHREACSILDIPEPELYVSSNPFPNAFAGGVERPYVVVRSAMIETLTDEELFHLIGHELGHIKAGHILYFTIARFLAPLLEALGRRTFGLGDVASVGLVMAMAEWSRQAELSADRAGLLVSQSLDLSLDANMKLCAGPTRMNDELDRNSFLDQARAYQDTETADSVGKMVWFFLMNWQASHPMFVHRAQALDRWVVSGEFGKILQGQYPKVVNPGR